MNSFLAIACLILGGWLAIAFLGVAGWATLRHYEKKRTGR